jgi:hypothetical protein
VTNDTTTHTAAIPAAWYRDPTRRHELRYWDGTSWTLFVSDRGEVLTDLPRAATLRRPPTTTQTPLPGDARPRLHPSQKTPRLHVRLLGRSVDS